MALDWLGKLPPRALADDPIGRIVVPIMLVLFASGWVRFFRRNRAIRSMVKRREWQWLGEALPYYLPDPKLVPKSTHGQQTSMRNAFAGRVAASEFVAFDCAFGSGKHRVRRTLLCVQAKENPFGVARFDSSYTVTEADGWFAISTERPHPLGCKLLELLIDNIR